MVMRHYDRVAHLYDRQYREEQSLKIKSALRHIHLKGSDMILDAGCGTGILLDHIENSVGLIIGLDISSKILKEAAKRVRKRPDAYLIRADVDYMPFPNGMFDKVFAITLIQNTPSIEMSLNEIIRVSKPDAIFIITGLKKAFSLNKFLKILEMAKLKIQTLISDERLHGYIAICVRKDK